MSDYVMLPPDNGSRSRKALGHYLIIGFLLVVVAAASWWAGQRSSQSRHADAENQAAGSERTSSHQLALSSGSATAANSGSPSAPATAAPVDPNEVGGILIDSLPQGAQVKLRNTSLKLEQIHATPATVTGLPAGFYEVTVSLPGYQDSQTTFEVVAHKIREMDLVTLERTNGRLQITTSGPARYEIFSKPEGGQMELVKNGETPSEVVPLPTGTYELALSRVGWPTIRREVTIAREMTTEVAHDFPEGTLEINSEPSTAEVWLKGEHEQALRMAGKTPLRLEGVPTGAYEVVLRHPDGPDRKLMLDVRPKSVVKGMASWNKTNVLFTSDPPGATVFNEGKRMVGSDNPVTPFTTELLEGSYSFTAMRPGLENIQLTVNVDASKPQTPTVHFPFAYGSLRVVTVPEGANVFLDQNLLGQTPLLIPNLRPATYKLLIHKERYGKQTVTGVVQQGNLRDLSVKLNYDPLPIPGEDFTNGVGQRMKWIPELQCWCEATETPQRAYQAIVNDNPSHFTAEDLPVENVNWTDAVKYCEQLTIAERGQGLIPPGYHYTLPTDAQWSVLVADATLEESITSRTITLERPSPVGSRKPNRYGLYDIRGNVWEWCLDWYSQEVFIREQQENASGKQDRMGSVFKILRGGSWSRSLDSNLAIGYRLLADPNSHTNYESGFRVILARQPGS